MDATRVLEKGMDSSVDIINKNLSNNPNSFLAFLNYIVIFVLIIGMFMNTYYLRQDVRELCKSVTNLIDKIDVQSEKMSEQNVNATKLMKALIKNSDDKD